MNDPLDLLQIKIENAKKALPEATRGAIDAVDWRAAILSLRAKRGYTFEQLGDLELETELLLAGLVNPDNYPRELEQRLKIPRGEANELVSDMNDLVFRKIREELIKSVERKKIFENRRAELGEEKDILSKAGIEIISPVSPGVVKTAEVETAEPKRVPTLLTQKMSESFKIPGAETRYSLNNISRGSDGGMKPELPTSLIATIKPTSASAGAKISPSYSIKGDPYRLSPEE